MARIFKPTAAFLLALAMLFAQGYAAAGRNKASSGGDKPAGGESEAWDGGESEARDGGEEEAGGNKAPAAESADPDEGKEEVVYGVLTGEGDIKDVYIVNVFNVSGSRRITDYGTYRSVKNLTNTDGIELSADRVSFQAEKGRFYYQGDLDSPRLPWNISVSYLLNGSKIAAGKLAGESGDLEIRIAVRENTSVDSVFFDNYMLQISLLLDAEKCTSIAAEGAVIANAGGDKQINFTVMPKTEKTCVLSASVSDFEMKGITIAGIPFSADFDSPDTGEFTGELTELTDAIGQINHGTSKLAKGIGALQEGADKLAAGSSEYARGMCELSRGGSELVSGSRQIKNGIDQLNAGLSSIDLSGLDKLGRLPDKLRAIADALDEIAGSAGDAPSGSGGIGDRIKDIINAVNMPPPPEPPEIPPEALADPALAAAYEMLRLEYAKLDTVHAALSEALNALKGIVELLPSDGGRQYCSEGIKALSKQIRALAGLMGSGMGGFDLLGGLGQLKDGVGQLAANYGEFHNGLVEYTRGVSEAAHGYSELNTGIAGLADGIRGLKKGSSQLSGGTRRLARETSGMDEKIQDEVDKLIADYKGGDFDLISFASPANTGINSVQFVITADGIEKEDAKVPGAEKKPLSFWEKLAALFDFAPAGA